MLTVICTAAAAPNRLERLVADLGSADPEVRTTARTQLMDLNARQLAALADAAEALPELNLNQRDALRTIVNHVSIASEAGKMRGEGGFLGVQFPTEPAAAFGNLDDEAGDGVFIRKVHIGFPAFQHLRPGDVIVGFGPDGQLPIRSGWDLIGVLTALNGGDFVTLQVRRGVEIKAITLRLASNFTWNFQPGAQGQAIIDVQNRGMRVADQIWEDRFDRLFPPKQVADAR
ncbi:MAG: PDZ domain-containing protein [Planctomycetota bacterium]